MIKYIKRYGVIFKYDTNSHLIFNHFTGKWIRTINKSVVLNHQCELEPIYYYQFNLNIHYKSNIQKERINKFLTVLMNKYKALKWINDKKKETNLADIHIDDIFEKTMVYFSHRELELILGYQYQDNIEQLKAEGLIELYYKESLGFINKMNKEFVYYQDGKNTTFFIPTSKILSFSATKELIKCKTVHASLTKYYRQNENRYGQSMEIFEGVWNSSFIIDKCELYKIAIKKYQERYKGQGTSTTLKSYLRKYDEIWDMIEKWNSGSRFEKLNYFNPPDSFSGRFHSIFSQLPIEVIKTNDTFNLEIDIAQCQLVLLADYMLDTCGMSNSFTNDILAGVDVYVKIQHHFNLPSRSHAKERMFELLFGSIYSKNHQEFKMLWPDAVKEINRIKQNPSKELELFYKKKGEKVKKHAELARLLQIREVQLFRIIYKELFKVKIQFATRHDGLIINESDKGLVIKIVNDVLSQHLKVPFEIMVK